MTRALAGTWAIALLVTTLLAATTAAAHDYDPCADTPCLEGQFCEEKHGGYICLGEPTPTWPSDEPKPDSVLELESRSKGSFIAGGTLFSIGTLFVIPSAVLMGLMFSPHDNNGSLPSGFGGLEITTPIFLGVGTSMLFAGLGLMIRGGRFARQAKLELYGGWEAGESSLPDAAQSSEGIFKQVSSFAVGGLVLSGVGALSILGMSVGIGMTYADYDWSWCVMAIVSSGVLMVSQAISIPLLLLASVRARHATGLVPFTPIEKAAWVLFPFSMSVAVATVMPNIFTVPTAVGLYIPLMALGITAGVRALQIVAAQTGGKADISLMPFSAPIEGGMVFGLSGAY